MFAKHDPVHLNLKPGGERSDRISGPQNVKEWAELEDYLGLFEYCEIMIKSDLIDEKTFSDIFGYRLNNIIVYQTIVDAKFKGGTAEYWRKFEDLLERMHLELPK